MMSRVTVATKQYVGMAKAVPDSRTPRRFSRAMTATTITAMRARCPSRAGKAEARLATPEDTETATVRV